MPGVPDAMGTGGVPVTGGTEATTAPPQPKFDHTAYGVEVSWLGEDGGMVALGHIPDQRFVAACNHLARSLGLSGIFDDPLMTFDDVLGAVIRPWAVAVEPDGGGWEWAISWHGITSETPSAFPVTVLWP